MGWHTSQLISSDNKLAFSNVNQPQWSNTKITRTNGVTRYTVPVYTHNTITRELQITSANEKLSGQVFQYNFIHQTKDSILAGRFTINGKFIERGYIRGLSYHRLEVAGNRNIVLMGDESPVTVTGCSNVTNQVFTYDVCHNVIKIEDCYIQKEWDSFLNTCRIVYQNCTVVGEFPPCNTTGGGTGGGGGGAGGDDGIPPPYYPPQPPPVRVVTDSLQGFPCAKNILDSAVKLNNMVSKIIKNVFMDSTIGNLINIVPRADLRDPSGNKLNGLYSGTTAGFISTGVWTVTGTIYLDEDLLTYGSKEAIFSTMLHEFLHAYLALEVTRISSVAFTTRYPYVAAYIEDDPTSPLHKFYRFKTEQEHSQMAVEYRDALKTAILQFNPSLPPDVAEALSLSGFFEASNFPNSVVTAISYELDTRKKIPGTNTTGFKATKCPPIT